MAAARSLPWNEAEISARTARRQQRAADALQRPRGDEHVDRRREPHSADASANQTTPTRKTRRRPKRSPSEPPSRINAARVSV